MKGNYLSRVSEDTWSGESVADYLLSEGLRRPDHVAVVRDGERLTYRQLADRAHAVARDLADRGLRRGDIMIVESDPLPSMLVVILACWIVGAIYVPISPGTPTRRRDRIFSMCQPIALAADRESPSPAAAPIFVRVRQGEITVAGTADNRVGSAVREEPPPGSAYVIFTSGTTGTPKGIIMTHRSTRAFYDGMARQAPVSSDTRVASIAPLNFDFSLLDWGLAAQAGATLVQVPRLLLRHPRRFVQYLKRHEVTMVSSVPSIWPPVLRHAVDELAECASLSAILLSGEAYSVDLLLAMRKARHGIRIINAYGQSESIACSFLDLPDPLPSDLTRVPIGPAHAGAELLILNDEGQPVECGATGEAYLRSTALFAGYWGDPVATKLALVPPPNEPNSSERIYRTGDLLRREEDGLLSFAGRVDHQVKVNGNRVELEEVERVLTAHPSAEEAVATVVHGESGAQIAAVIATRTADDRTAQELRVMCRDSLPQYMVPTHIVFVLSLPRTDGGKIDRCAAQKLAVNGVD